MKQAGIYLVIGGCIIIAIFLVVTFFKVILSLPFLVKIALLAIIVGGILLLKSFYDERTVDKEGESVQEIE